MNIRLNNSRERKQFQLQTSLKSICLYSATCRPLTAQIEHREVCCSDDPHYIIIHRKMGKQEKQVPRWEGKPNSRFSLKCHLLQEKRKIIKQFLLLLLFFFSIYALQPSRFIVRPGLDVPNFASPRVSQRESTTRRKVELWARNVREFCLNCDFHVTFRDLLHAVKLRHGSDGFTSPPKEGVLRIFSP
jgi:hypothetical protein